MMINTLEDLYRFDRAEIFSIFYDPSYDRSAYTSINITNYITIPNEVYNEVKPLCFCTQSGTDLVYRYDLLKYIINKRNNKLNKI